MGREVWDFDFSDHRTDDSYQEMHDNTLLDPREFPTSSSSSRDHRGIGIGGGSGGSDEEIDITARHALVLGGVVVLLIISFLAYLLCRKNPPPSPASAPNPLPHRLPTTRYGYGGQQGDRRQFEEDLPPSYNQLEQMDLLCKSEDFSVPPPSYEEINKEEMV